jgi:hypothetical protein
MLSAHLCGVGIAMAYGLASRGSILSRGKIFLFSVAFRFTLGPTQPPIQCLQGKGSFSGDKATEA